MVLDGILRQQRLRLPFDTRLEWRPDQVVEQKRSVYQESKTHNLQPLEGLPAKTKRHNPNEQCTARVDGGARRGGDGTSDRQSEKVEAAGLNQ